MAIMISLSLTKNISTMGVSLFGDRRDVACNAHKHTFRVLLSVVILLASGCAVVEVHSPIRIALLAPFEGRYREVGYEALYAARLAMQASQNIELLPIDDGGTTEAAAARARAIAEDPLVRAVVALGYAASAHTTQAHYGDLPVVVVGNWLVEPQSKTVFILSNSEITTLIDIPTTPTLDVQSAMTFANEVASLGGFVQAAGTLDGVTVLSSYPYPDDNFRQRILESDTFATEPRLLATGTYDALGLVLQAMRDDVHRGSISDLLNNTTYTGISGQVSFSNGYWQDAPIYQYVYSPEGHLVLTDDIIEER